MLFLPSVVAAELLEILGFFTKWDQCCYMVAETGSWYPLIRNDWKTIKQHKNFSTHLSAKLILPR